MWFELLSPYISQRLFFVLIIFVLFKYYMDFELVCFYFIFFKNYIMFSRMMPFIKIKIITKSSCVVLSFG